MRHGLAIFVLALVTLVAAPPAARGEAAAGRTWCMTYCDAIHVGCKKTLGWLDEQACDDWHSGCLDGCRVGE